MITFDVWQHELQGEGELAFAFPLHDGMGTAATAAVLFEVAPGGALPIHTDSAEETLLVLRGEGEATVGDEVALVSAGQVAVVPPSVPHGIRNTGDEPLRVLGFFAGPTVRSVFEEAPGTGEPMLFLNGQPVGVLQPA